MQVTSKCVLRQNVLRSSLISLSFKHLVFPLHCILHLFLWNAVAVLRYSNFAFSKDWESKAVRRTGRLPMSRYNYYICQIGCLWSLLLSTAASLESKIQDCNSRRLRIAVIHISAKIHKNNFLLVNKCEIFMRQEKLGKLLKVLNALILEYIIESQNYRRP